MAMPPSEVPQMALDTRSAAAPRTHQLIKRERRMFASSDDNALMKQIQATHVPDGRVVDVKPILQIIEEVFRRTTPSIDNVINGTHENMEMLDDRTSMAAFDGMLEALAYIIHKISCEMQCKCSGGGDAHATTMVILNSLSNYSWDAKVVITLAAFAVSYGEFWLVAQLFTVNPLAKSVAFLKQMPDLIEYSNALKPHFDALNNLIKAMLKVTKCIVAFKDLPSQYISEDTPAMAVAMSHIPTAAYWTIRSTVACASQIIGLIGMRHEFIASTTEAWELSSLAHKMISIHDHLSKQYDTCLRYIDEKKHEEKYQMIKHVLSIIHMENYKILVTLFGLKDDTPPLWDGSSKTRASLEVLRKKHVLLFISDLDLPHEEIIVLDQMYRGSRERNEAHYEVVWVPIVDRSALSNEADQHKFQELQSMMSWYSIHDPSVIDPAVVKYIKEEWHFLKRAIIVVLDPQGRITCLNALHMMWIWGNLAFPFTVEKEETLWRAETWRLELLVDGVDLALLNWIMEGKYICLYGGEDMNWIQNFTKQTREVARVANITMEILYVGKSKSKERVRKLNTAITAENLSHCWEDLTSVWYFWSRLESMLYSKLHHGMSVEDDPITREVMTVLSFDGSDGGWAIFCRGSAEMTRAKGDLALKSMLEFDNWRADVEEKGFIQALNDYLFKLHTPQHCNRLILPGINGGIPERVVCAECGRPMEKYYMYRCCVD